MEHAAQYSFLGRFRKLSIAHFLVLSFTLFIAHCIRNRAQVTLKIQSKTHSGEVVAHADVFLNNALIGQTDELGVYSSKIELEVGQFYAIKIQKAHELNYFSPFSDTFAVESSSPRDLFYEAIMFVVPKPQQQLETSGNQKVAENSAHSSTPHQTLANAAGNEGEDSQDKSIKEVSVLNDQMAPPSKSELVLTQTFHVFSNRTPVQGAEIKMTNSTNTLFNSGCKTNQNGRCSVRLPESEIQNLSYTVLKDGFIPFTQPVSAFDAKNPLIAHLEKGMAIEIQTHMKHFQRTIPIEHADVFLRGEKIGSTDQYGRFLTGFKGRLGEFVPVVIKTKHSLSKSLEVDFIVSDKNLSLNALFAPKNPPTYRVLIQELRDDPKITKLFHSALRESLVKQMRQLAFLSPVESEKIDTITKSSLHKQNSLNPKPWNSTRAHDDIDGVLGITIEHSDQKSELELTLIDSTSKVLARTRGDLAYPSDIIGAERAATKFFETVRETFPLEGAIIGETDDGYEINIGQDLLQNLRVGDQFDVYGLQSDLKGKSRTPGIVGRLEVTKVETKSSRATVRTQSPRSLIKVGSVIARTINLSIPQDFATNRAVETSPFATANELLVKGKLTQGIRILNDIPKGHPDYLLARHRLGEIYLTHFNQPEKAVRFFGEVTQDPSAKSFVDKRFISSHINEGVALVLEAERVFSSNKESARSRFKRAQEIFSRVEPELQHLNYIKSEQAIITARYYKIVAFERTASIDNDPKLLQDAAKQWKEFIDFFPEGKIHDVIAKQLVKSAQKNYERSASMARNRPMNAPAL